MLSLTLSMVFCALINFWYGFQIKTNEKIDIIPINLYRHVTQDNFQSFVSLVGNSNYITAAGFLLSAVLSLVVHSMLVVLAPAIVGLVISFVMMKKAQKQYNTADTIQL